MGRIFPIKQTKKLCHIGRSSKLAAMSPPRSSKIGNKEIINMTKYFPIKLPARPENKPTTKLATFSVMCITSLYTLLLI